MERTWKRLVKLQPRKESTTPPPAVNRSTSSPSSFEYKYKFEPPGPATKKALRLGIPGHLRPMAWFYYSGGEALRDRHPSPTAFYESLLLQPKPSAFFLLTDRMKMDFRDVLPTNEILRKDYFSSANTMINEVPDVGRVRIIPDRVDSPNDSRPRRMTIFDREPSVKPETSSNKPSGTSSIPFMSRLYNVLVAFFMFRSRVEYCRAICSIAATLLLVIQDEEKTFWTLSALFSNYSGKEEGLMAFEASNSDESIQFHDFRLDSVEGEPNDREPAATPASPTSISPLQVAGPFKYFPDDMFRDTSTCSFSALDGFRAILESKKPGMVSSLKALDIPISLLTTTWFQSLFVDVLPTESSMRVLDAFIGEGYKVLYRVALALFYINEAELMQKLKPRSMNAKSIFGSLLNRPSSPSSTSESSTNTASNNPQTILNFIKFMPKKQIDADVLMDFAFNRIGSLSMSSIYTECKRAAEVERPLQSIRRFSQTPETKLSMDTIRRVSTATPSNRRN
jgi:hypothetical protein